jgi:hypothetical protein
VQVTLAPTRLDPVLAGGAYVYGSYPDVGGMFQEQASELDRTKREAILHTMQQLVNEKAMLIPMLIPMWELASSNAYAPRVEESGFGLMPGPAYSGPSKEIRLKPDAK